MTKIKTYSIKNPVVDGDKWIGSNGITGETKNFSAEGISAYILGQLTPIEGGQLKITEIVIDTLDTDVSTTVNAITPAYEVLQYEMVFFTIEDQVYLLKSTNVAIGDGETALTNDDFIVFPVSVGPTGPSGTNGTNGADGSDGSDGADGREVEFQVNSTHIQWRYVGDVSWTNLIALSALMGPVGTTYVDNGTTTRVGGEGTSGNPYFVEVRNLQKTVTSSFTLADSDNFYTIFVNNSSTPITITVPSTLTANFSIAVIQLGSADVTFAQGSGTTILSAVGNKIKGQYYSVVLEKQENTATYVLSNATKA